MSQEQQLVLLRQYLDVEQSVSCRWLANTLDVTIDMSKELLQRYKAKNHDVFASYFVSGKKTGSENSDYIALSMEVVPEDRLDACKKNYTTVSSIYIYSLQRTASTDKVLYQQLNSTDLMQVKSYVMMSPKNISFLLNKSTGGIVLKTADINELGQRQILASSVTAGKTAKVSENADEKMARMFANRTISKGKSVADSASFFAPNKPAVKPPSTTVNPTSSSKKEDDNKRKVNNIVADNPASTKTSVTAPSDDSSSKNNDEDDEWDDGVGYKPDKSKLKKSKKESDELNSLVPELADKNGDDIADIAMDVADQHADMSQNTESKKSKTFVHGAMDDYMEDVAVAIEIAKENNPQQVPGAKKMKKKLVEKLYSTEDGYLETRYEYEEVTDDELPVEKKASPKKMAPAAKKDDKKASTGQQKGMMSFFSKK